MHEQITGGHLCLLLSGINVEAQNSKKAENLIL